MSFCRVCWGALLPQVFLDEAVVVTCLRPLFYIFSVKSDITFRNILYFCTMRHLLTFIAILLAFACWPTTFWGAPTTTTAKPPWPSSAIRTPSTALTPSAQIVIIPNLPEFTARWPRFSTNRVFIVLKQFSKH